MLEVKTDDEGLFWTVDIGLRTHDKRYPSLPFKSNYLQRMEVGVWRLAIIQPAEEIVDIAVVDV